jgi:hypothetical protein
MRYLDRGFDGVCTATRCSLCIGITALFEVKVTVIMAHLLAAASSFLGRTNISQSYNIGNPSQSSRPSTPGTSAGGGTGIAPTPFTPAFHVGLWKVQPAMHKTTGKRVSVWSFDKRGPEMERMGQAGKDRALEVMKNEVQTHPSRVPAYGLTTLRHRP